MNIGTLNHVYIFNFSECTIDPNQQYLSLTPADRYGIAHELAHIKHEDYAVRWMVQVCVCGACMYTRCTTVSDEF